MLNSCILEGRLVADPELKTTTTGKSTTTVRIAVDGNAKDAPTDFINVVAWNKVAEFLCNNFSKGAMLLVEGALHIRPWETKEGEKRYATEVVANKIHFCGGKSVNIEGAPSQDWTELSGAAGDLPF